MRIPSIRGVIERRILVNFRVDPEAIAPCLPSPFRPKLVNGYAIAGICLIRLTRIRPRLLPIPWGISSENAAHRIAVEWDEEETIKQGVYIPRRDTNSLLNTIAGGRVFPGVHHHSRFEVDESEDSFAVKMDSGDQRAHVLVKARIVSEFPSSSVFPSKRSASEFFEHGSLGYSDTNDSQKFDGIELRCFNWHVDNLKVDRVESSYFDDRERFPSGSVELDCALLMRNIAHEWHSSPNLCCAEVAEVG